ncbi:MAG: signal peptidase I [Candidatus Omnitrophica bacterium]|nr:signal peptidase I [Candidatus Omnitrophota bacterium]
MNWKKLRGRVRPEDLSAFTKDLTGLWDELLQKGYLDKKGLVTQRLYYEDQEATIALGPFKVSLGPKKLKDPSAAFDVSPQFAASKKEIFSFLHSSCERAAWWEWVDSFVVALVLAFFIQAYFFQPFKIPSGSMRMTLIESDRLFVNKLVYGPSWVPLEVRLLWWKVADSKGFAPWEKLTRHRFPGFAKPKRGDVVVFRFPVTQDKDFIKRLIAVGGETVEIKGGRIWINDKPVEVGPKGLYYLNAGDYGRAGNKIKVPTGYYFVMGDNTGSSYDGRYWGFVPEEFLIGKADCIFWPLNRIRWIK